MPQSEAPQFVLHGCATLAEESAAEGSGSEPLSVSAIIRRHHGSLISFLRRRLRVSHDADDVAQETYVRMMQYEGSREIRSPSSMLFRIAINVANDLGRSQQSRCASAQRPLQDVELVSDLPSAEREIEARQDLELLYEAIAQLPPKCRQVFLLSRVRRMTYPEIARHCGVSLKAVEKHISHALALCAEKLDAAHEHATADSAGRSGTEKICAGQVGGGRRGPS
jgi:RNA polymerase sigma-70 factor (ECF subfamily)